VRHEEAAAARTDRGTRAPALVCIADHHAGFSLERIGDYVGHSAIYMTDRYRHLIQGHEAEAAQRFDEYLGRARR
jgi:hypothetical protein